MMAAACIIPLSNGGHAVVDSEDVEKLAGMSWYGVNSRHARYAKTGRNNRMHRIIMAVTDPDVIVDHINGDGLDNRKSNLRLVSSNENVKNRQRSRTGKGYPGVFQRNGKWAARVTLDYKQHRLGSFASQREALESVNAFRIQHGRPPVVL